MEKTNLENMFGKKFFDELNIIINNIVDEKVQRLTESEIKTIVSEIMPVIEEKIQYMVKTELINVAAAIIGLYTEEEIVGDPLEATEG